ncbi:MAG: hypothetical protein GF421_10905 [Candidatus Aminicenantes bacterium]|nr:hypothetical protein [Candidatus Aminicenantes bacterium]
MIKKGIQIISFSAAVLMIFSAAHSADWFLDMETGWLSSGYNNVRIPNATGTLFSLSEDLDIQSKMFVRFRAGVMLGERHAVSLLAAPLTLNAQGQVDQEIFFFEEQFPAQAPLDAVYTFNSYRATYRYDLVRSSKWTVGIGFTAKIRDAVIKVESLDKSSEKTNVGFVPLLHFRVEYFFTPQIRALLEGDALASPGGQGRAEDILLGLVVKAGNSWDIKAGYRMIEGGADVDEVYNFAWLNLYTVGTIFRF